MSKIVIPGIDFPIHTTVDDDGIILYKGRDICTAVGINAIFVAKYIWARIYRAWNTRIYAQGARKTNEFLENKNVKIVLMKTILSLHQGLKRNRTEGSATIVNIQPLMAEECVSIILNESELMIKVGGK